MLMAFALGLIAGLALLAGAVFGILGRPSKRFTSVIMAFGSGVLISALTFDLIEEAYNRAGILTVTISVLAGAVIFVTGDWLLGRGGAQHRKRLKGERSDFSGEANRLAITLGALLDGVPESMMIGAGLLSGQGAGLLMFAAVFLSNLPEGISGAVGVSRATRSKEFALIIWTLIALACGAASLVGFRYVATSSPATLAAVSSLAAGSILAMITDTMIPEAFEEGGTFVALATVAGFMAAFVISKLA